MHPLTTIGRLFFALPFAVFGISHFINAPKMAGYVPVPGGVFWVYFTGLALLAGSVSILTRVLGKWGAVGLGLLMLIFVFTMHIPHLRDPQMGQMSLVAMLKDLSLAGGAFTWAGLFATAEGGVVVPPARRVTGTT